MSRSTTACIALLALLAVLSGCVAAQTGSGSAELSAAAYTRQPNNDIVDLDSQTVIAATILQMMRRDTSMAPVVWAKDGSFKAAYEGFTYEGFGVTGVDVFDQQQAPDGKITVQALVRMQHTSGVKAANVILAVYSDGSAAAQPAAPQAKGKKAKPVAQKGGVEAARPVIHKTLAGPIPSRDPALEVLVVPSDKVLAEPAFKEASYPGWLAAARRLAVPAPTEKAKVHVFVFAKERVLAGADLKVDSGSKTSGQAACIDDFGFAACVVSGEISGMSNKALFYLNGKKAAEAAIK